MARKPDSDLATICNAYKISIPQRKGIEIILSSEPSATQEQLAESIGVARTTLYRWMCQKKFLDALADSADIVIQGEWPHILKAIAKKAKEGDAVCAKWIGEITGRYQPKAKIEHSGEVGIKSISQLLDMIGKNGKSINTRGIQTPINN